jgi:pimeloyl-ACP methyl ester carboxylesterase
LIDELGGPAIVVGNSLAAGAAVILAAQHPRQVSALVLLGPFVRNPKVSPLMALAFRAATARPWVAMTWKQYLPTLYAGRRPGDFDEYRTSVIAALRRPGYAAAFSRTIRQTDHAPAEAQLHAVDVPVLVVMGERDPDFADPADEARWIGEALRADVVMVPEAGHYPQSQQPELTTAAVEAFLSRLAHA